MKQLVEYISQFEPDYPATIRGARPDEIEKLESVLPQRLPTRYREFLTCMGHGTGVLRMEDVDFDIDHPLRIHTHKRLPIPPRYLFVGLYRSDPDLDYYLDLDTPGGEPSVVRFPRSGPGTRYFYFAYDSLPEMLFSLAFRTIRMPRLPYQRSYGPGDWPVDAPKGAAMEKLDALVEKLGFQKLSFVGNTAPCYERGNAAISGYEPDAFGFSINVAAESDIEAKRLGALLEDHMGIQFSPD